MPNHGSYALRILTGPQAGQIAPLQTGYNIVGRSPSCQVKIASNSISKEHATILLTDDGKLLLTDMNSRNGTYVNGLRVQNQKLKAGDKITMHDIIIDVLNLPPGVDPRLVAAVQNSGQQNQGLIPMPQWAGNAAVAVQPQHYGDPAQVQMGHAEPVMSHTEPQERGVPKRASSGNAIVDMFENIGLYIDHVAMPGMYAVVQRGSFRQGLALLVVAYVIMVTAVATLPMIALTKKSIRQESIRRAKTIARNLAAVNRQAILEKNEVAVTVRLAELEEGVSHALILAKDGTTLAPANKRGEFSKLPFVNQARREERETEAEIDDSTLGVAIPISRYNPEEGQQEAAAYAVVLYDMGSMAMNPGQTLGLFMQIFLLASAIGGLLYFFLIRVVEHPLHLLGLNLDDALREGRDDLTTPYSFPQLERVISNVNSALSRAAAGDAGGGFNGGGAVLNRDIEATNVVRMLPIPALSVNAIDDRVIATNGAFDRLIGGSGALQGRGINEIPDPALQANLRDLLPRMREQMGSIAYSELPFSGEKYEINGQAVVGNNSEAAWYLVTLSKAGG